MRSLARALFLAACSLPAIDASADSATALPALSGCYELLRVGRPVIVGLTHTETEAQCSKTDIGAQPFSVEVARICKAARGEDVFLVSSAATIAEGAEGAIAKYRCEAEGYGVEVFDDSVAGRPATPRNSPLRVGLEPQEIEVAGKPSAGLSLDPGEPFGIVLKGGVLVRRPGTPELFSAQRRVRVDWGLSKDQVSTVLGKLTCTAGASSEAVCFTDVSRPWWADFGEFRWTMDPLLLFSPSGTFFSYQIAFPEAGYDDTKATLIGRLGRPISVEESIVQNRMGASFGQEVAVWKSAHVAVLLMKRGNDLTKGSLSVTYLPLFVALPPAPTGKAPF